ncbi:MAG TPA: GntR family transcriptional regulator [Thermodesulfobacteriota bacterium]|nr:GntR family transcriptional regulator [Thermodesulfobacteriota bacterium]
MGVQKSKKAIVYETLKKRIINHTLRSGDPLNESTLSKELKISKTPIREAFQQLEKEGFIESIPGRGAFVSRISIQDIRELFEIREILECEVIKRVASKGDLNKSEAEAIGKKYESSEVNGNKTPKSYFKAGDQIHTFIFEAFGNKRLLEFYKRLQDHIERLRLYFFNQVNPERSEQSFKEHLEIINALVAQDPQRAEKAMRAHLQNSLEYQKRII